jgi:hypothetical protein
MIAERVAANLASVRRQIEEAVRAAGRSDLPRLVGVTKGRTFPEFFALVSAGLSHLAENRWESWISRIEELPEEFSSPLFWHFIGPIQTRSLKRYYRPLYRIDTVDSLSHAEALSRLAASSGIRQGVLIEVNVCRDPGRTGILPEALVREIDAMAALPGILCEGLMIMGPDPKDKGAPPVREVFSEGQLLWREALKMLPTMKTLSMGMSEDFAEAIRCGSTEVRIGRILFEEGTR